MINDKTQLVKYTFEEGIPMHKFLGLKILLLEKNFVRIEVPFREELVGDFRNNRLHGGVIATVMDSVGGVIGVMNFTSMEDKISTIDLRVDYLRGAKPETIIVEGKTIRFGNRILVARMKAFQNDKLIAEGKGVYNFVRMDQKLQIKKINGYISAKVSPCLISPLLKPFINQYIRCSEVPWVKVSGRTLPVAFL